MAEVKPVEIVGQKEAIPVKMEGTDLKQEKQASDLQADKIIAEANPNKQMGLTAASQKSLTTAGQRRINLIWEFTQAFIAATVITTTLVTDAYAVIKGEELNTTQLVGLANLTALAMLVVGFYFSRTNHQNRGGTGEQPNSEITGR